VGLSQIAGQGKTSLALKFIEDPKDRGDHRFGGIFRFTFYGGRTQAEFAAALSEFLVKQLNEPPPRGEAEIWLGDVLRRRAVLLFLDGIEVIQPAGSGERCWRPSTGAAEDFAASALSGASGGYLRHIN